MTDKKKQNTPKEVTKLSEMAETKSGVSKEKTIRRARRKRKEGTRREGKAGTSKRKSYF